MGFINQITDWIATPYTIFLIIKDPTVPRGVKWRAGIGFALIFAYIVSPFDIIPDVIPLAGCLDDLIIVPLGFAILRIITPGINVFEKRNRAQSSVKRVIFLTILALVVAVLFSLAWLGLIIFLIVKLIAG
jgi:uncharacterized membrane protein YkvA (DUF1232 family)